MTTQCAKTLLDAAKAVLKGKTYSCKYYLAMKRNEVLILITMWMNPETMF